MKSSEKIRTENTKTGNKMREDGRKFDEMREIKISTGYIKNADGSCLIEVGDTRVICTASVDDGVPRFLRGQGKGWITAEYGMIPGACDSRVPRESTRGKKTGRTHEIQRLIGRSMRSVIDTASLGERTIWLDCDVIQADGGTRCASITGSYIALILALNRLKEKGVIKKVPVEGFVAAISVGVVDGETYLDLAYSEDSRAEVDMNVVMTNAGEFIEVQGTAEGKPFSRKCTDGLLDLATSGIERIVEIQKKVLGC